MRKIIELTVKYDDGQEQVVTGDALIPWAEWLNYQLNGVDFPDVPDLSKCTTPAPFLEAVEDYTGALRKLPA